MEVHHPHPHLVVSFHDVLSQQEADGLVSTAQPRMQQASIGHGKEVSEMRVSRNCWIKDFESKLVDSLSPRINWITGLQTSRPLDVHNEGQEEEYEQLQIANYGIGGHYQSHQDPMFVYKEPEFLVYSVENKNGRPPYVTGDRLATFMLYLSEVMSGLLFLTFFSFFTLFLSLDRFLWEAGQLFLDSGWLLRRAKARRYSGTI